MQLMEDTMNEYLQEVTRKQHLKAGIDLADLKFNTLIKPQINRA